MLAQEDRARFEADVIPHRDAAYNLARWILRGRAQAEDVTQDAFLRAYRSFGAFQSGNARAWLLQIVRNCCFTWLQQNHVAEEMTEFDEQTMPPKSENPESLAMSYLRPRAPATRSRRFARAIPRNHRFARTRRLLVQRNRRHHHAPHRHRDVCARSRTPATKNSID